MCKPKEYSNGNENNNEGCNLRKTVNRTKQTSTIVDNNNNEGCNLRQTVNRTKQTPANDNERRWIIVLTALFVIFVTMQSVLASIIFFLIKPSLPTLSNDEIFDNSDITAPHVTQEMSWKVTDSSPISILFVDDADFLVYTGFITWLTVIFTGIGLEMFVILVYLKDGWTVAHENLWKLAQFLFSLLALVTLSLVSTRNSASLLTLVFGLWKFGFQDTVATMYSALYDISLGKMKRFSRALDATGLILHHSAASLIICMLVTGAIDIDRFIFDPILILCMQHWFALLHDKYKTTYTIIELVLEFWFEWDVISNFEHYLISHWTIALGAAGMLVAHWIWLASGVVSLLSARPLISKPTESVPVTSHVSYQHLSKISLECSNLVDSKGDRVTVSYTDENGNNITVSSDEQLTDAFQQFATRVPSFQLG